MHTDFAAVARLLANPARSAMLSALMEGRALTAGELARRAGVAASTTSEHLAELLQGGLVDVVVQGRHRYFRLHDADVAAALEALARICPPVPVRALRASTEARALAAARVCYDHLAGTLGVELHDALLANGWLRPDQPDYALTARGEAELSALGVAIDDVRRTRRRFAYPCLDWTARRFHLAGALAAAITETTITRGWVQRTTSRRALRVSAAHEQELTAAFGLGGPFTRPSDSTDF